MPTTYTRTGASLGEALGALAGSDDYYQKGVNDGNRSRSHLADAALKEQEFGSRTNDRLIENAAMSAGVSISPEVINSFKQMLTGASLDIERKPLSPALAGEQTSTPIPVEMQEPSKQAIDPKKFDLMRSLYAASRSGLASDDKNILNILKAALSTQTAAGAGNDDVTRGALLANGKTQFDPSTTGVTNIVDGTQTLNAIGESQRDANKASVGARQASANNSNASAQKNKSKAEEEKETKDRFASVRDDIRSKYSTMYKDALGFKKGAPSLDDFELQELARLNIPADVYFNAFKFPVKPGNTQSSQGEQKPVINKLPEGSKKIGTSNGKPVYQTPDGKRFLGD